MRNVYSVITFYGLLTLFGTYAFNIDVHIPIIKQGPAEPSAANSYFGYSVSPHKIIEKRSYRVLVGAPLDNMTNYMIPERPSGALYSCPITMAVRDCDQILMLKPMRQYGIKNIHKEQWLGVNVYSDTVHGGGGSFAYTCGHRFMIQHKSSMRLAAPGICMAIPNALVSSGMQRLVVLSPNLCQERSASLQDRFCLRGTALASRPDLDVVAMGAANERRGAGVTHFARFGRGATGAKVRFKEASGRAAVRSSNAGYSVALGRILKGPRLNFTLVSGAPSLPAGTARLSTLQWRQAVAGQVALYGVISSSRRSRLAAGTAPAVLPGEAFGSRFGHSLLTIDLNGDGWDDLLVGAPDFQEERKFGAQPSLVRGSGAVYLFMNKVANAEGERELQLQRRFLPRRMSRALCRSSSCSEAAFGSSIAALGDLNFDGFPDVAIGAPGEGNGAVYIYHGDRSLGLSREPSQVILASTLSSALRGFGAAVSGGLDLDSNRYPDLVVGAPFSGHAVILRARPVLEIISSVIFLPEELDPGLAPSSNLYDCPPDGRCFEAKVYLTYRHAGTEDDTRSRTKDDQKASYKAIYSGEVNIELDAEKSKDESRVVFKNGGGRSLRRKVKFRHQKVAAQEPVFTIILFINPKSFMDKMTPISLRLAWSLELEAPKPPAAGGPTPANLPSMERFPVFNAALANRSYTLSWRASCASKPICLSDLNFQLRTSLERAPNQFAFLLGREDSFWLNFTISNVNEEAHMTFLHLDFSYRLALLKTECPFPCDLRDGLLRCPIANPLGRRKRAACNVKLSGSDVTPDTRRVNFSAWLTTVSRNVNSGTTKMNFSANVLILADIQLKSIVTPEMVVYKKLPIIGAASVTLEDNVGPPVTFTLSLKNAAPSGVVPASYLSIRWPYELAGDLTEAHGQHLLYLLRPPRFEAAKDDILRCDRSAYADIVNVNNVRLLSRDSPDGASFAGKPLPELHTGLRYGRRFELCGNGLARCRVIRCRVGLLSRRTGAIRIRFEARVWSHTLVRDFSDKRYVPILVNVTWEPEARFAVEQTGEGSTTIDMQLVASSGMPPPMLPPNNLWLFVPVAIVGGLALFGCIILVLRKLNFFRRDKRELEQRLAELQERREEEKHKYEYMEYD